MPPLGNYYQATYAGLSPSKTLKMTIFPVMENMKNSFFSLNIFHQMGNGHVTSLHPVGAGPHLLATTDGNNFCIRLTNGVFKSRVI